MYLLVKELHHICNLQITAINMRAVFNPSYKVSEGNANEILFNKLCIRGDISEFEPSSQGREESGN